MRSGRQPARGWIVRWIAAFSAAVSITWPARATGQEPEATARAVRSEERAGRTWLEIGVYGGAFVPDERHEFYDWRDTSHKQLDPLAPELGVRIGLFPLRFLGLEGEADVLPTSLDPGGRVFLYGARAHLVLQIPARVTPFVLGGFGVMGVRSDRRELSDDSDALGHVGVGLKLRLGQRLMVRIEGRALRAPKADADGGTNHFAALFGVSVALGGSRQPIARSAPVRPRHRPRPAVVVAAAPPQQLQAKTEPAEIQDADGDKLPDPDDRCPLEPGAPDGEGCPDRDRDRDGVADPVDNCPDQSGAAENRGCRDPQLVLIGEDRLILLRPITFTTNRARIRTRSLRVLDNVAAVLLAHPEMSLVQIEGHTDDRGHEAYNRLLSQRRADQVRRYVVERGVPAARLEPIGYGESQPIESNTRAAGRARNRRVEFHIGPDLAPSR